MKIAVANLGTDDNMEYLNPSERYVRAGDQSRDFGNDMD